MHLHLCACMSLSLEYREMPHGFASVVFFFLGGGNGMPEVTVNILNQ